MIQTLEKYGDLTTLINRFKIVVLKFSAEWCGPCHALQEELNTEFLPTIKDSNDVLFLRVDTDEFPESMHEFGFAAIPLIFIFYKGKAVSFQYPDRKTNELVKTDRIVGFARDKRVSKTIIQLVDECRILLENINRINHS